MTPVLERPFADRRARLFVPVDADTSTLDETESTTRDRLRRPVILRNWSWDTPFTLTGCAYGHPRFADGTRICTSVVVWIDEAAGYAQTLIDHCLNG